MASTRVSPPLKAKQHTAVFVSILLLREARLRQFVSSLKGLQETEREGEAEESLPLQLFPGGPFSPQLRALQEKKPLFSVVTK